MDATSKKHPAGLCSGTAVLFARMRTTLEEDRSVSLQRDSVCCLDRQNLTPACRHTLREPELAHRPGSGDALHDKKECVGAVDMIDGVYDEHESPLPLMDVHGKRAKEVRLHGFTRRNTPQSNTCLLVAVAGSVHGMHGLKGMPDEFRRVGRWRG